MQLQFTRDELGLLAGILEQQASGGGKWKAASYALLDRVIAHDLCLAFDELEDLQDILSAFESSFRQQLATATPETRPRLAQKEQLLEKVIDKVTEACAMV